MPEWTVLAAGRQRPRRSHAGTPPSHRGRRQRPRDARRHSAPLGLVGRDTARRRSRRWPPPAGRPTAGPWPDGQRGRSGHRSASAASGEEVESDGSSSAGHLHRGCTQPTVGTAVVPPAGRRVDANDHRKLYRKKYFLAVSGFQSHLGEPSIAMLDVAVALTLDSAAGLCH